MLMPLPACLRTFQTAAYRLDTQSLIVARNCPGADTLQAREALLCSGQQLHEVLNLIAGRCCVCEALQMQCSVSCIWVARAVYSCATERDLSCALTVCCEEPLMRRRSRGKPVAAAYAGSI